MDNFKRLSNIFYVIINSKSDLLNLFIKVLIFTLLRNEQPLYMYNIERSSKGNWFRWMFTLSEYGDRRPWRLYCEELQNKGRKS